MGGLKQPSAGTRAAGEAEEDWSDRSDRESEWSFSVNDTSLGDVQLDEDADGDLDAGIGEEEKEEEDDGDQGSKTDAKERSLFEKFKDAVGN